MQICVVTFERMEATRKSTMQEAIVSVSCVSFCYALVGSGIIGHISAAISEKAVNIELQWKDASKQPVNNKTTSVCECDFYIVLLNQCSWSGAIWTQITPRVR